MCCTGVHNNGGDEGVREGCRREGVLILKWVARARRFRRVLCAVCAVR